MLRHASVLTVASALGQLLQLTTLLILTKLYPPAAFGELTIATTASAFFAVLIGLQLPFAITSAKNLVARREILKTIQVNAFGSFVLALPIAIVSGESYAFAALVGSGVCVANMLKALAVAEGTQTSIAYYYLWRAALICSFQFILSGIGPTGLAVGLAAGEIVAAVILSAKLRINLFKFRRFGWKKYIGTVKQNTDFTFFGVLQEAVSITVVLIPFVVADWLYTGEELGNYGMAYRFTWGPVAIIGTNVGWLFLGALGRRDARWETVLRNNILLVLMMIVVVVVASIFFEGVKVISNIYDFGEWRLAVKMLPILITSSLFFLVSVPYRQAVRVHRKQRVQLVIDGFCAIVLLVIAGFRPETVLQWVTITAAIIIVQNVAMVIYGAHILRKDRQFSIP